MASEGKKGIFGSEVDHTFREEVFATLGWVMAFAASGIFIFSAGGGLAAISLVGALSAVGLLAIGIGLLYCAARERKKQKTEDESKTVRVELAQGQKSITIDLAAPTAQE